jgi:hypothetical protein
MDIAHTKFLGRWNSVKGCMEWTEFVGEVNGYLGDFSSSKSLVSLSVNDEVSQQGVKGNQEPQISDQQLAVSRGRFPSPRNNGKKGWKKRTRSQLLLEDETVSEDGDPISSFYSLGGVQAASPTKRAKHVLAAAAEQPRHSQ